jgi:hypothetical protein
MVVSPTMTRKLSVSLLRFGALQPFSMSQCMSRIMELEGQSKLLVLKSFWNDKPFVADKKAIILI